MNDEAVRHASVVAAWEAQRAVLEAVGVRCHSFALTAPSTRATFELVVDRLLDAPQDASWNDDLRSVVVAVARVVRNHFAWVTQPPSTPTVVDSSPETVHATAVDSDGHEEPEPA